MISVPVLIIRCDGRDAFVRDICRASFAMAFNAMESGEEIVVAARAKEPGWLILDQRHYCPRCKKIALDALAKTGTEAA